LAFPEIDVCIHGRSIRGDALQALAELMRANAGESGAIMRELLARLVDINVYRELSKKCASFRAAVKRRAQAWRREFQAAGLGHLISTGGLGWEVECYHSITVFESLGHEALRLAKNQSVKRPWWRFW
jgi:hypothetical protein